MKNILITGANSYIGISLEKWLEKDSDKYSIDTLDMKDNEWKNKDFSKYDVVFHVAGIAHIKETKENAKLYYKVNRDLVYEVAKKAKNDGVRQFIFLSSMSVYGMETGVIGKETIPDPKSNYGKSKLQAEELIAPLGDSNFRIAIVRPPMVYGKGCKGNYIRLKKFALKTPIFPEIENKRSMIYINNLCEFVKLLIDDCGSGLFLPQNEEYVATSEMVKLIAKAHGKKMHMTKLFNPLLKILKISTVNKVFGDLVYEKSLINEDDSYCLFFFKQSVRLSEE
ncbi:NAD-dependent epimerase/dehydratase family protein [Clostridium estertheticum]|uniref:NAD-dependent epimerase/dehydratase family protein n=1 Tax=Clostridium estertheticum TaxID=238834 RepID=UPI001C0AD470|nr:NAD-dependent epimerase/dehydratase family protein [Clostridium estertheticum]MBU3073197.1 NAD-dependent epimerase/dehydratase family protein [Clostridium estertheticum]MBU3163562.1 NAD-dependent epimerase/dehydratase family protein [Clostridium estertheticum]